MVSTTKQLLITESSLASREKYNSDYGGNISIISNAVRRKFFCLWTAPVDAD